MNIKFNDCKYEIRDAHSAANCLPLNLKDEDFIELIESVGTEYDPEKPVLIQQSTGLVISGRRRLLACKIAGVEPVLRDVDWDDERIAKWVRTDELVRRNLTPGQRAAAFLKLAKLNQHGGNRKNQVSPGTLETTTIKKIADEAGVGKTTVCRVKRVKDEDPNLFSAISDGDLNPRTADECLSLPSDERQEIANSDNPQATAQKILKSKSKKSAKRAQSQEDKPVEAPETVPAPPVGKLETYYKNDGIPDLPGVYRPRFMRSSSGHEVALDAYGTSMPASIGDTFADTQLRQLYFDLSILADNAEELRKQFMKLKANPKAFQTYTWLDIPTMLDLFEDFRNAAIKLSDQTLASVPYAVCPDCHGTRDGCKSCKCTGYWPRTECEVYPNRFKKAGVA